MLIAIEGVDLTGKSTLAAQIADAHGATVIHSGPPEGDPIVAYVWPLANYKPCAEHVVLDRWHVGEYVWPEVFRRRTQMADPAVRRHVELFMASRGCVVVYAQRDYAKLHAELAASDEPLRPASLALALNRFDEALEAGCTRGFVFSHDYEDAPISVEDLAMFARHAEDDVAPLHAVTGAWMGTPHPHTVIAYSTAAGGSDPALRQLIRSLPEHSWRGFAVVDATVAWTTDHQLHRFAELTACDRWIAVGDDARKRVLEVVRPRTCLSVGFKVLGVGEIAWEAFA